MYFSNTLIYVSHFLWFKFSLQSPVVIIFGSSKRVATVGCAFFVGLTGSFNFLEFHPPTASSNFTDPGTLEHNERILTIDLRFRMIF